ncbi:hypothetical protein CCR75_003675 [Bremia lactucae]|uniref:HRDC domain-containing protein n=1 Tax=Bremia lactucae TaxID=4779 RepID=A0A976IIR1_BRELC|nr:hypothetical protein CCR75_003675 [Bremia lactucae]
MRVKKLNVNRRYKVGEDEVVAVSGDSDQRKCVSPTESQRKAAASNSSGSSSPTDVQQQYLSDQSPFSFHSCRNSQNYAVVETLIEPNATATDVVMHEIEAVQRDAMVDRLVETLRSMKPHAPEKVLVALPRLAQHMEKALFKMAKSEAEYSDLSTLRMRISYIQETQAKRLLAQQQKLQTQSLTLDQSGSPVCCVPMSQTDEQAHIIFQHLQSWRQKLVDLYGVAPWDILPNPTLARVSLDMPVTEQQLLVCGVGNEQVARFGISLLQELQRHRGRTPSKIPIRSIETKQSHKVGSSKRGPMESLDTRENKNRKNGEIARSNSAASFKEATPAPLLPAVDSLPTLLPIISDGVASSTSHLLTRKHTPFSATASTRSPSCERSQQESLASRMYPSQPHHQQQDRMQLLVQGAGQLENAKSVEVFQNEIKSLRWMLHVSRQENSQLEKELKRLRAELQHAKRKQ